MRAEAILLSLLAAGCGATRNLETGAAVPLSHVRTDAASTWDILAGGPRWIARDVGRDWRSLKWTLARAAGDVEADGKATLAHVSDLRGFVAREAARDLPQLRRAVGDVGRQIGEDAKRSARTARDAPGWFGREFEEQTALLAGFLRSEGARARQDARELPGAFVRFFQAGLW